MPILQSAATILL